MSQENLVIHKLFTEIASRFPQKIALQIKEDNQWKRISYKELEMGSLKVANFLLERARDKGDFVALLLENRPEWPMIYLGIMYAGCSCVPLDFQLSPEEIRNLILDSNTKILFCSDEVFTQKISQDIQKLFNKIVVIDLEASGDNCISFSEIERLPPEVRFIEVEPEDIASLIYTSGTTAQPKGVLLTHKNICSNFTSSAKVNLSSPRDNFLSILPLHHSYPFMTTLIVPLLSGATVTFSPLGFKPQDLAGIIKEAGVTILVGVPQLFSLLHSSISEKIKSIPFFLRPFSLPFIKARIRHNFGKNLRVSVSGGARLEPKMAQDLTRWGFKIIEGYGLTETSPVVTFNPLERVKFGSVGKPIPSVEIKIDNPDKTGIGQILIKGPNVMKGYFKQPDLTLSIIKDGWFFSGDLGYIDKEGYLFITGREKEVIILSSGKTIYPEELEAYYSQSPYIKELCILQRTEEIFGYLAESLYAVIVPDLDYFQQKNEMNIRPKIRWELENLTKHLPPYKHIMGFVLTKEKLPRTALRKIQRYKVREMYLEKKPSELEIKEAAILKEDLQGLNQEVAKKIINYISSCVKKPVFLESHLEIDLGIDSLSRVELGLGLEALLSIKIPDEVLYSVSTVKDVIIKISEIIDKIKSQGVWEAKIIQKTWGQILREPPKKEIFKKIRIETHLLDWLLIFIFKHIFLLIFRIFWLLSIKERKNLPKEGPYLICPNHASYLDGFVVFCSLPLKIAVHTYFLGYSDIFEHPLVRWAIKLARLIPLDPETNLTKALQAVSFVLSHKKIVCIFPEGQRSIDENLSEFKKGVGILIRELDIPVVPVYIKGSHQSWPRGSRLPQLHPLKIIFGQPFSGKELDDYEGIALGLREEVLKLVC